MELGVSAIVNFSRGLALVLVLCISSQSFALPCLMPDGVKSLETLSPQSILKVLTNDFPRHSKTYYRKKRSAAQESASSPEDHRIIVEAAIRLGTFRSMNGSFSDYPTGYPYDFHRAMFDGDALFQERRWDLAINRYNQASQVNPNIELSSDGILYRLAVASTDQFRKSRVKIPVAIEEERKSKALATFDESLPEIFATRGAAKDWRKVGRKGELRALIGIVRCGYRKHPVIFEAMGDLLLKEKFGKAKPQYQLAAMAYLRASYLTNGSIWSAKEYRKLALNALPSANEKKLRDVEVTLGRMLKSAKARQSKVAKDEMAWIQSGKDPDAFLPKADALQKSSSSKSRSKKPRVKKRRRGSRGR